MPTPQQKLNQILEEKQRKLEYFEAQEQAYKQEQEELRELEKLRSVEPDDIVKQEQEELKDIIIAMLSFLALVNIPLLLL